MGEQDGSRIVTVGLSDVHDEVLARLVALNGERAAPEQWSGAAARDGAVVRVGR